MRKILAALGGLCGLAVALYQLTWWQRSALAKPLFVLGVGICLVAVAMLVPDGKEKPVG